MRRRAGARSDRRHRERRRRRLRRLGGFGGGGGVNRGNIQLLLDAEGRAHAVERADRHGPAPPAVGHPRRDHPRQRVGRQQPAEPVPLGRRRTAAAAACRSRSAARTWTTRSGWRRRRRSCSTRCPASPTRASAATKGGPSSPCASIAPKAALLGVSATRVANTIRTNVAGTQAAMYRAGRQRVPDHRPPARGRAAGRHRRRRRAGQHAAGQVMPAKNLMRVENAVGPVADRAQEPAADRLRQRRARDDAERGGGGRRGAAARSCTA